MSNEVIIRRQNAWTNGLCLSGNTVCTGQPSKAFCYGCLRHVAAVFPAFKEATASGLQRQEAWAKAWKSADTEEAIAALGLRKEQGENWIVVGDDATLEIQERTKEALEGVDSEVARVVEVTISLGLRKYM